MPYGKYPDRVKPFRKWAGDRIDKAEINDRATSTGSKGSKTSGRRRPRTFRRKRRFYKKKREE